MNHFCSIPFISTGFCEQVTNSMSKYFRLSARDLKIVAVVSLVLAVLGGIIYSVARYQWSNRFLSRNEKTSAFFQFFTKFQAQHKEKVDSLPPIPSVNYNSLMHDINQATNNNIQFIPHDFASCRFLNILCPLQTRVDVPGCNTKENPNLYWHANNINLEGQKFIASQYPVENLLAFFWMGCQNSSLILDLTNSKDRMLLLYYPKNVGETLNCGTFSVTCTQAEQIDEMCQTTSYLYRIQGTHNGNEINFVIPRIHYQGWGDHLGVNVDNVNNILEIIDYRRAQEPNQPVVVHCRAGVGRTGTVIVCDALKHLILQKKVNTSNLMAEIQRLILEGRAQRGPEFVQTAEQLQTIHQLGWQLLHRINPSPK